MKVQRQTHLITTIGIFFIVFIIQVESAKNETKILDPFEEDADLRYAADAFCEEYTLNQPMGKIVLPYKPNCHFWWQCTATQLKKNECQGSVYGINLHYDLYLDRCEMPKQTKCLYKFDEEEIIMEYIMEKYIKQVPST